MLVNRWTATAPWWQLYLVVTVAYGALTALGGAVRLGGRGWLVMVAITPVAGALLTWWAVAMRRGDQAATGADPVTAMEARKALTRMRPPEDPALREVARRLLPRLRREHQVARRVGTAAFAVVVLVAGSIAAVRRSAEGLVAAGSLAGLTLVVLGVYTVYGRRYDRIARELDDPAPPASRAAPGGRP